MGDKMHLLSWDATFHSSDHWCNPVCYTFHSSDHWCNPVGYTFHSSDHWCNPVGYTFRHLFIIYVPDTQIVIFINMKQSISMDQAWHSQL